MHALEKYAAKKRLAALLMEKVAVVGLLARAARPAMQMGRGAMRMGMRGIQSSPARDAALVGVGGLTGAGIVKNREITRNAQRREKNLRSDLNRTSNALYNAKRSNSNLMKNQAAQPPQPPKTPRSQFITRTPGVSYGPRAQPLVPTR